MGKVMRIHILGICGTFMGGIALLARELGFTVEGSDANVYPPMSTQLEEQGITLCQGYDAKHLKTAPDLVVVGNAIARGNAAVEYILAQGMRYISGPQFLADYVLTGKWVLAVAGTHGKTTTSSMVAWMLEYAGMKPGFLIGGVPENFGLTARLGKEPFFVVEADEYDTAFFDKRSKFVHYRPRTAILNNLEFDHADIFPNLDAIKTQFHHLVRTVPGNGKIILPGSDENLAEVIKKGCWSPREFTLASGPDPVTPYWTAKRGNPEGSIFDVFFGKELLGTVRWDLAGDHNVANALAAIAAARHAGVPPSVSIASLTPFRNVKRRMEIRGVVNQITVYDDFAHHPTAIRTTLDGLRKRVGVNARIVAVLEARSNSMRMGVYRNDLAPSLMGADRVLMFQPPDLPWDLNEIATQLGGKAAVFHQVDTLVTDIANASRSGDHILIMSNGGFGGIHGKVLAALQGKR